MFSKKFVLPYCEAHKKFPIGSKVKYLGVDMVVKGHWDIWDGEWIPLIKADYVGGDGVIREKEFKHWQTDPLELA